MSERFSRAVALTLEQALGSSGSLGQQITGATPEFLIQEGWGGESELLFLTSFPGAAELADLETTNYASVIKPMGS